MNWLLLVRHYDWLSQADQSHCLGAHHHGGELDLVWEARLGFDDAFAHSRSDDRARLQMFLQSCLAAIVATWSPLLPAVSTRTAWTRFTKVTRCAFVVIGRPTLFSCFDDRHLRLTCARVMTKPQLFLKCVPALGPHIDLEVHHQVA